MDEEQEIIECYSEKIISTYFYRMSTANLPELPSAGEALSQWLGFKLPAVPLPQTFKNIDKAISRVVGLVEPGTDLLTAHIERKTLLTKAKSQTEVDLIRAASALRCDNLDSDQQLAQRAIEFAMRDSILKQQNKETIARLAIEHITQNVDANTPTDTNEEIDDDWLSSFEEIASKKSNKDIQSLWAKILSGEIRKPGSFSLRSLSMLSAIDHTEANKIHILLSKAIDVGFIYKEDSDDLSEVLEGEYLGVLKGADGILSTTLNLPQDTYIQVGFQVIRAEFNAPTKVKMGAFPLTPFGKELFLLSETYDTPETYIKAVALCLARAGGKISRAPIIKKLSDGKIMPGIFVEVSPEG